MSFSRKNFGAAERLLGEHGFKREYLGIPGGAEASPFSWDLYERATQIHAPLVPPGRPLHRPRNSRALPTRSSVSEPEHSMITIR